MIAALYVQRGGCYWGLDDIDPWDQERDARQYKGPHPVIAHPPCKRWGRYWGGGPMMAHTGKYLKGDDDGCFAHALWAVRTFGGVIEHPEASWAWKWYGLNPPPKSGGWVPADILGGWTCCVEQGHYGHKSRKATWLYAHSVELPSLIWGKSEASVRLDDGYHSAEERRKAVRSGVLSRLSKKERAATPLPFRDLLVQMARTRPQNEPAQCMILA